MDDDDKLSVYRVLEPKGVEPIRQFKKEKRQRKREYKEKKKYTAPKEDFKEDFLRHFKLDKERFSVNLIKSEGRWIVEVCNKRTKRCVYHDYDVVCDLMDRICKLPDSMIGYNINVEA